MLQHFRARELIWPIEADMTDTALEVRLYGVAGTREGQRQQPEPDWAAMNRELKRKHVTPQILWDEYIETQPDGYRYSRFCQLYRVWEARMPVTMRQTHLGGDRLFVDYAGDTVPVVVDRLTGELLYDPQVNRTSSELADHYGTSVLPARPYRPRDKAKVEACVGIVERWLLGRLRHRVWHGLALLWQIEGTGWNGR